MDECKERKQRTSSFCVTVMPCTTKEVRREWPGGTEKEEAEMMGPTMRGGDVTLGYKSQSEQQCKSSVC